MTNISHHLEGANKSDREQGNTGFGLKPYIHKSIYFCIIIKPLGVHSGSQSTQESYTKWLEKSGWGL